MATLVDPPTFIANEVYEIQATDSVEGAAIDASFSGLGISNQPHQQLANRTSFLKQRQDVNIASLGVLRSFMSGFVGLVAGIGYLKIPVADVNRGSISAIVEWGSIFPGGGLDLSTNYPVTWPLAFPNSCLWAMSTLSNSTAVNTGKVIIDVVSLTKTAGVFRSDRIGGALVTQQPNDGFYWMAIGF
jgi:tail fiber protein gp53